MEDAVQVFWGLVAQTPPVLGIPMLQPWNLRVLWEEATAFQSTGDLLDMRMRVSLPSPSQIIPGPPMMHVLRLFHWKLGVHLWKVVQ